MLDFAEGRITTEKFLEIYKNDEVLRNVLIKDKNRKWGVAEFVPETGLFVRINKPFDSIFRINADNLLEKINIDKLQDRYELFDVIYRFFSGRKI